MSNASITYLVSQVMSILTDRLYLQLLVRRLTYYLLKYFLYYHIIAFNKFQVEKSNVFKKDMHFFTGCHGYLNWSQYLVLL